MNDVVRRVAAADAATEERERSTCPACGRAMRCEPAGRCWCMDLPPMAPVPEAGGRCLCPDCLTRLGATPAGQ
ncbi:cysteine-rich CWC family protein [Falsiroseomonas oryzae]|uniref:cysteine-rich CWC family protein n=1 Tax=Falsiroseomonas oryzae TaxID=2766473 RepID=UPI0022EB73E9|nr:cysteine-rich CWC family protein [Roseomonas sp. MO-31]